MSISFEEENEHRLEKTSMKLLKIFKWTKRYLMLSGTLSILKALYPTLLFFLNESLLLIYTE